MRSRYDDERCLVMLRWILPLHRSSGSARDLIRTSVSPAVRASGWLSSPGTTHHVSDRGPELWLTVITVLDDTTDVRDELTEFLRAPPSVETGHDPLLASAAEWYRRALQDVSRVALDVIEAGGRIPLAEYQAFESPADAALLLARYLDDVSASYRRACPTYEEMESFWLSFFKRGPTPQLPQPGRGLWNLAG